MTEHLKKYKRISLADRLGDREVALILLFWKYGSSTKFYTIRNMKVATEILTFSYCLFTITNLKTGPKLIETQNRLVWRRPSR